MEGNLLKWVNIFDGWKSRYFVLNEKGLSYLDQKEGKLKGFYPIESITVTDLGKDYRFLIETGGTKIEVKSDNSEEKFLWISKIKFLNSLKRRKSLIEKSNVSTPLDSDAFIDPDKQKLALKDVLDMLLALISNSQSFLSILSESPITADFTNVLDQLSFFESRKRDLVNKIALMQGDIRKITEDQKIKLIEN